MPPDWREVDPTEARKSRRFALELVFEDGLMARREGDEDEGGGWGICKKTMGGRTLGADAPDLER